MVRWASESCLCSCPPVPLDSHPGLGGCVGRFRCTPFPCTATPLCNDHPLVKQPILIVPETPPDGRELARDRIEGGPYMTTQQTAIRRHIS